MSAENIGAAEVAKRAVGAIVLAGVTAAGTLATLLFWPESPWRLALGLPFGLTLLNAIEVRKRH